MKKRILSIFLVIAMLVTMLPVYTISSFALTSGDFKYEILNDGTVEIVDYIGSSTELIIPSKIDGYSVTSIGNYAFSYYTSLESVTIPESVTTIGDCAFYGCTSLHSVVLPNAEITIGQNAFWNTIYNDIRVVFDYIKLEDDTLKITNCHAGSKVTELVFPSEINGHVVTQIGNGRAVMDARSALNVKKVVIPDSITAINDCAFEECDMLKCITIGKGVKSIGMAAFYGCYSLEDLYYTGTATDWAKIKINSSGTSNPLWFAKNEYFNGELVTDIIIDEGITEIRANAFAFCESLRSIVLPNSLIKIGDYAFDGCQSLESVVLKEGINSIGEYAFYDCEALKSINIPNSVTKIEERAFNGCQSLESVVLKEGINSIGEYAFYDCEALKSINIPNSVTKIEECAFNGCISLKSIKLPNKIISIGQSAFYNTGYYNDENNWQNTGWDKTLYIGKHLLYAQVLITLGPPHIDVNVGTKTILGGAFVNAVSVTVPYGVELLGTDLSPVGTLEMIELPSSIRIIEDDAFVGDNKLTDIYYAGSKTQWDAIDKGNNARYLQGVNIHYNYKGEYYKNGWIKENGKWAFFENDVKITNQWKKDSVGWCYLDSDGYMAANKWIKDSVSWCYVGSNGYCLTNKWVKDSVGWCYLGANGQMATNQWVKDSVGWCYVGTNGYCVTNKWVKDSVGWCYLDAGGHMSTNKWIKDSVGWCYVGSNGYCVTNQWVKDSVGWCYLDFNGRMLYSSWVEYKSDIYYIGSNGYMVTGTRTINGTVYQFSSNGALIV